MTSEKELRKIAREEVACAAFRHTPLWEDYPELTEDEWVRVVDLISDWPIPDLPEPEVVDGNVWFDDIMVHSDGTASDWGDDLPGYVTVAELRERAAWLLAAADYAERNQE